MPRPFRVIVAAAASVLALALTGCAGANPFASNAEETRYPGYAEAAADEATPDWIPEDAVNVWVRSDDGDVILRFESGSPIGDETCTDGPLEGEPDIESSWFPFERPADGKTCGEWRIFGQNNVYYAWTTAS